MGLFDIIKVEHPCTNCGDQRENYQTKALGSFINEYHLGDKPETDYFHIEVASFDVYDSCSKCKTWMDARVIVNDGIMTKVIELDENKNLGNVVAEYLP